MPAPDDADGRTDVARIAGVDGCRAGWLWVSAVIGPASPQNATTTGGCTTAIGAVQTGIAPDFKTLITGALRDHIIMVDMPIGLRERGRRACEQMARARLGPRRSSVFSAPRRAMLDCIRYEDANVLGKAQGPDGGGGLSKQAWHITPKIRDVDNAITPDHQKNIGEAHPELAFTRLGGAPCQHAKATPQGAAERIALLERNGLSPRPLRERLRASYPYQHHFRDDDLFDACALVHTALARIQGDAWRLSDDFRDARGLILEIWG